MSRVEIVKLQGIESANFQLGRLCAYLHQTFLVNLRSLTKSINWLRQEERNGETQPEIDRKIDIQKPCAAATTTDIEVSCSVHNGKKLFLKLHFHKNYMKLDLTVLAWMLPFLSYQIYTIWFFWYGELEIEIWLWYL